MSWRLLISFLICVALVQRTSPFSFGRWGESEERTNNEDLKQAFLTKLGLSHVPNVTKARTTAKEREEAIAIYERSLRDYGQGTVDESDVQRLYTFKDNAPKTGKTDVHLLSFEMGDAGIGLMLHSAKLYVFKKHHKRSADNSAPVELYQLMESSMLESPNKVLIQSRRITFGDDDWEAFDVTTAVATWLEKPMLNHGLALHCKECSLKRLIVVTADTAEDSTNRAVLDISVADSFSRIKKRSNPFFAASEEEEEEVASDCSKGGEQNNLCCRYSMWVSFKDMGWDWIVKPEGFHAYYCKGQCPYDYINYANTHALLQSIYNTKYDKSIPPPCCVPKSLKPLSILHYSDSDPPQLVVSRQTGMIAESCGCA